MRSGRFYLLLMFFFVLWGSSLMISCSSSSSTVVRCQTQEDCPNGQACINGICTQGTAPDVDNSIISDDKNSEQDIIPDGDEGVNDVPVDIDNNPPGTCSKDEDCAPNGICDATGHCIAKCRTDADCNNPAQVCNTNLGRCVHYQCKNCTAGQCCIKRGTNFECTSVSTYCEACGSCNQGDVCYPTTKQCVTAACPSDLSECGPLPGTCYKCDQSTNWVCAKDPNKLSLQECGGDTEIKFSACIPSGEKCDVGGAPCCSGQPCIQGYCY